MKTLPVPFRRSLLLLAVSAFLMPAAFGQVNPVVPVVEMTIDVRNGDQQGKLILRQEELAFESLTDAKHSRAWRYAEIRSLEKKRKEVRVRPFKGSRYDFQFPDNKIRDMVYESISRKILMARSQTRK